MTAPLCPPINTSSHSEDMPDDIFETDHIFDSSTISSQEKMPTDECSYCTLNLCCASAVHHVVLEHICMKLSLDCVWPNVSRV